MTNAALTLDDFAAPSRARTSLPIRWRRRGAGFFRISHRWLALVFGLLLIAETTSGSVLLYESQIDHWSNSAAYTPVAHSAHPISLAKAIAVVAAAHPKFAPDYVGLTTTGVYEVYGNPDYAYTVDPGSGKILGQTNENAVLRFIENLHECAFTCKGDPGYLSGLNHKMPGLWIPGLKSVTIADFILGVLGLVLLLFCISGLIVWWPGIRRFGQGFVMRLRGGSYRRDRDLHKVVGIVVLPFLLIWAVTGAGFEFPFVQRAAYAVDLQKPPPDLTLASKVEKAPDITYAQAVAAALRVTHGGKVVAYSPPGTSKTGVFQIDIEAGLNAWSADDGSLWNLAVSVDRHNASRTKITYDNPMTTPADTLFDGWGSAWHYGFPFNGWARIVLFLAGMSPLLLGVTGASTWLVRRKRRRAARRRAGAASSDLALGGELAEPASV